MGRYLERAEHTVRVMDVNLVMMLDQTPAYAEQRWERLLRSLQSAPLEQGISEDPQLITQEVLLDRNNSRSVISMLASARDNARQVRNQIPSEMWEQVNRLYLNTNQMRPGDIWGGRSHDAFRRIIEGIQLFHGITEATMRQDEGWYFLQVGRYLERVNATIALLDAYFNSSPSEIDARHQYLDWLSLLKSRTAFEAYCQEYTADLRADRIASFLLLNNEFPHSALFAIERAQGALQHIAELTKSRKSQAISRIMGRLHAQFAYAQIDELLADDITGFLRDTQTQCGNLNNLLHEIYFLPPIEAVFAP